MNTYFFVAPEVKRARGSNRVIRGGSWNNNPANVRVANRNNNTPDNRNNNIGFRLANTADILPECLSPCLQGRRQCDFCCPVRSTCILGLVAQDRISNFRFCIVGLWRGTQKRFFCLE